MAHKTVDKYNMLEKNDTVVVGVSGGADSVGLLLFLLECNLSLDIHVCHINHCLRGEESDGDQEFTRQLAQRYNLPFHIAKIDVLAKSKEAAQGVEEYSRDFRYNFFAQIAGGKGKIATAHTLSDATETTLFHLIRGTGIKGLCGIPYCRGNIIRPLRDCTRDMVEAFLEEKSQNFRIDSSNLTDDYSRNFIRHQIVPNMVQMNPSFNITMADFMCQMQQQWDMTMDIAELSTANHMGQIVVSEWKVQAPPVKMAIIQNLFTSVNIKISKRKLIACQSFLESGKGTVELSKECWFVVDGVTGFIKNDVAKIPEYKRFLELPTTSSDVKCLLHNNKYLIMRKMTIDRENLGENFYKMYFKNLVQCVKIESDVFAFSPSEDDKILLQGKEQAVMKKYRSGPCGKTTGEISAMALVGTQNRVIWAEGLGVNQDFAISPDMEDGTQVYFFGILEEDT